MNGYGVKETGEKGTTLRKQQNIFLADTPTRKRDEMGQEVREASKKRNDGSDIHSILDCEVLI